MSVYCQVWDAHWCVPVRALPSAQDGSFLPFTATSLMSQTTEVLGSSQVCFTQHTYPKFSPVKKRNEKAPTTPTGWLSLHHTDVQVKKKKKNLLDESWIVSKRDEWCGGIRAHVCKARTQTLHLDMQVQLEKSVLNNLTVHCYKNLCWKMHF